jgi:phosphoadenosine phosphosulfate reductase
MSAIALYARETPGFDIRHQQAVERLRTAVEQHPSTLVQATSLGAEDMVLTDLIVRHQLPVALATLDTGALHPQTVALMDRLEEHYGVTLERYRPVAEDVVSFVATHGSDAMFRELALRKACCSLRKLDPLKRLLDKRTAWVTGIRRDQSDHRAEVPWSEADAQGRTKYNPLADWSWADVWHYIRLNAVPTNPLHDEFMPSIGCAPCTRAIAVGEPFRAGRWWWEDESRKECGLHTRDATAQAELHPPQTRS